jgi:hypothetical protein
MGRLGSFVPRLVALTAIWLLATTALTYAAAQRMNTPTAAPAATTATTAAAPTVLVVPDVRRQAYVFAKGSLGDAGFSWRVAGGAQGYPANTVVSQSPAAGTRVIDTGSPLIVLRLQQAPGKQGGLPETASSVTGTPVRLADLAVAAVPAKTTVVTGTKAAPRVPAKVVAPKKTVRKRTVPKSAVPAKHSPSQQKRPPAFVVAGARREPLDEIPLTARARALLRWVDNHPKPTDANVKYWLYQHAWIVTGAKMGWWHGEAALETLTAVDQRVFALWGIGGASKSQAAAALAVVRARAAK